MKMKEELIISSRENNINESIKNNYSQLPEPFKENNLNIIEKKSVKPIKSKDKYIVFLYGFAFLWIICITGILSIIKYLLNPQIPTWLILGILFFGFIIVWKLYFEERK